MLFRDIKRKEKERVLKLKANNKVVKQNEIYVEWARSKNKSIINADTLAEFFKASYKCEGCGLYYPLEDLHYENMGGDKMCEDCSYDLYMPLDLANDEYCYVFNEEDMEYWKQVL